jgi:hypothetical protein
MIDISPYRKDAETRERFLKSGSGRTYLKKQMREFFRTHPLRTVKPATHENSDTS